MFGYFTFNISLCVSKAVICWKMLYIKGFVTHVFVMAQTPIPCIVYPFLQNA